MAQGVSHCITTQLPVTDMKSLRSGPHQTQVVLSLPFVPLSLIYLLPLESRQEQAASQLQFHFNHITGQFKNPGLNRIL